MASKEFAVSTLSIFSSSPGRAQAPAPDPAARSSSRSSLDPDAQSCPAAQSSPTVLGTELEVPVSGGRLVAYANLDYAASAPCLAQVSAAVTAALPAYSSVHRGAGYASRLTTARYERARHAVRAFAGARPDDAVIFTRNTTDATNLLARCLPAASTVVLFASEHHASLLPWAKTVRLAPPASPGAALRAVDQALGAIDGPRLLAVTAASNVTGELWPIAALAHLAHRHGARILVDAAQLVPHRRLAVTALDLDYTVFSGHKLYAPFGAGVLIGRRDWLADGEPYLKGGGAARAVGDEPEWQRDPEPRHEAGTPNVLGAIALAAACEALTTTGWSALIREEERLLGRLRAGLAALEGVHELALWGPGHPRVGIVAFVVDGHGAREVAETLAADYGIGVRDGKFCAHPLVRHLLGSTDTARADDAASAVRASIGLGTTDEHIDRLLTALGEITAR